ncbi:MULTISPECIES: glutamine amidotransferase [Cupriavidus]|uniref:glutamine amidotransferase n=1 Tax=Cupriavidus sp. DF5525 TaxID=3160989 RepID=UPI0032E0119F
MTSARYSRLLIVQVGTPPKEIREPLGDLPAWFCRALERPIDEVEVVRVFDGDVLPEPNPGSAAIITGSWAMVTDRLPWSETTAEWIRDAVAVGMSIFGVCYGHQLMAHALGGRVDFHPDGREMGCHRIHKTSAAGNDPLLSKWPESFTAHLTHEQTIIELPRGAEALAFSAHDPHQIVRYGPNALSTQFHPEFTRTIAAACIRRRADILQREGRDPDAMLSSLEETYEATTLLKAFVGQTVATPAIFPIHP